MKRLLSPALVTIAAILLGSGCGPSYKTIEIDPRGNENYPLKNIGETTEFRAFGVPGGSEKIRVKLEDVVWASSNEKVATVDAKGKVTAVGSGRSSLSVKWKDLGDVVPVVVQVLAKLEVEPAGPVNMKRWEERQFKAAVKNELGDVVTSGRCTWQLAGVVAVANQDGMVRAREPGEDTLFVRCMGKTAQVKIIVSKEEYKPPKK
ncbi:MAG: Ig-like domain-containing protein [Deltaproteobacteria bacterium]|nr:Ig-like domain-containing protein [Deltaproteobacteria bacterium]